MPYIYREAVETTTLQAYDDETDDTRVSRDHSVTYLDLQYFFGSSMLIAPLFNETGEVTYYLPAGTWTIS